jgi:hypothetical protein
MKVQLTLSPEQLAIIAKALCYFHSARTALYYNDPIWKELGIIIDLAELEAIDGHKRTASYRIINQ